MLSLVLRVKKAQTHWKVQGDSILWTSLVWDFHLATSDVEQHEQFRKERAYTARLRVPN